MKRTTAGILAVLLTISLAGCGRDKVSVVPTETNRGAEEQQVASTTNKDTAKLYINLGGEPEYLDPLLAKSTEEKTLVANSFVGLYTYNAKGTLVTAIAADEAEVSEDGCKYTIHLKETKWSNGDPLLAEDFVYSWNRAISLEEAGVDTGCFAPIARAEDGSLLVEATDNLTLEITLTGPCPYFTSLLAKPAYAPVHKASVMAANPAGNTPGAWTWEAGFVCNGAYQLAQWQHDEFMSYDRNPNFYDAANVTMPGLYVMVNADAADAYTAYNGGDLDFADELPEDVMDELVTDEEYHRTGALSVSYLMFSPTASLFAEMEPKQAADYRQAISRLIQRKAFTSHMMGANGEVATNWMLPGLGDGNGGIYESTNKAIYRSKDVMGLLEPYGFVFTEQEDHSYTCEPALEIPVLVPENAEKQALVELLQQQAAKVGITLTPEVVDEGTYAARVESGAYTMTFGEMSASYDDAASMILPLLGESEEEVALATEITTTTDPTVRLARLHDAEALIWNQYRYLPLYVTSDGYLLKSNISGVYTLGGGEKLYFYATKKDEG